MNHSYNNFRLLNTEMLTTKIMKIWILSWDRHINVVGFHR